MSKRITYLLGAGASYNACPIWKEQGEKMIELAKHVLPGDVTFLEKDKGKYFTNNTYDKTNMFWRMGYYGIKAKEYGTIDTYARKLYLNNKISDLNYLKTTVSLFFTIWQLIDDDRNIVKIFHPNKNRFKVIDPRYITLLATCLDKVKDKLPKLNDNIKFVTWNYDLQLELAYRKFSDNIEWEEINKNFSYIPIVNETNENLSVCHLNGFNGFYETSGGKKTHIMDRHGDNTSLDNIINSIDFTDNSVGRGEIDFSNFINYAWEKESDISKLTRKQAIKIFSETDILVIIGYSFPSFNREIDKELLDACKHYVQKIIYQDPNASADYISEAFNIDKGKIETITINNDQFIIPSLF